jgi:uncharacterized protein YcfL
MNRTLLALPVLLALLLISGCTAPAPKETTPSQTVEPPSVVETTPAPTQPGLIDDSELAELENTIMELENEMNSLNETETLTLMDV